jgi:putative membrane protein
MKFKGLLVVMCAAGLMAGCNSTNRNNRTSDNTIASNNDTATTGTSGSSVSAGDKDFVNDMLSDGTAEVELGRQAKERAASSEVKQFAQMMVDDHTKAGEQLKQTAATYSIPQEAKPDDKHKNVMDKLMKLRGADFDKEYMAAMVDDHEDAVRSLRSRVDENRSLGDRLTGKNPENAAAAKPEPAGDRATAAINQWAANSLPVVERHLDRAKQIKENLDRNNRSTARADKPQGASKY